MLALTAAPLTFLPHRRGCASSCRALLLRSCFFLNILAAARGDPGGDLLDLLAATSLAASADLPRRRQAVAALGMPPSPTPRASAPPMPLWDASTHSQERARTLRRHT